MTDEAEKLQRFKQAVSREAAAQAEEIIASAQAESDEIIAKARAAASVSEQAKRAELGQDAERELTREISAARLESKRRVLICREQLADSVFELVAKKLADMRSGSSYGDWLVKAAKAAKAKYPDEEAEFCLAPEDMKYADRIGGSVTEDKSIRLGGMSIRFPKKGIMLDCTFDTLLADERAAFCSRAEL